MSCSTLTLEQQRVADALRRLKELDHTKSDEIEIKKRYRAYVERLGPMIVMNGLGQALATERAAAGPNPGKPEELAHKMLYEAVQGWLCREGGVYPGAKDVLEAIVSNDQKRYLHAQAEALAWLEWHKKFCQASLPRDTEV